MDTPPSLILKCQAGNPRDAIVFNERLRLYSKAILVIAHEMHPSVID